MYRGQLRSFCSGAGGVASEASGGGGAAGRPRIVAEGDVLRVVIIFGFVVEFVVYLNFHPIETHSSSYYAVRSITQFQVNSMDSKSFELEKTFATL